jgi:hypothetical protein
VAKLAQSTVLVVTACETGKMSQDKVIERISGLSSTMAKEFPDASQLLKLLAQQRKVLIFKSPESSYKSAEGPEMLSSIINLTTEWKR